MKQLVYFIQAGDGGPVKIGAAGNPQARLADLQTGNPERLSLLGAFRGGRRLELLIHEALVDSRLEGEWFEPSADLQILYRRLVQVGDGDPSMCFLTFPTENAISRENGGGGNRTRVTCPADNALSSEKVSAAADDDPRPPLVTRGSGA